MLSLEQIQNSTTQVAKRFNATSIDDKISSIALFGSYATQEAKENSDIDLLVKFNSAFTSLFSMGRLLSELEEALQVPVDIVSLPLPENSFITIGVTIPLYEN